MKLNEWEKDLVWRNEQAAFESILDQSYYTSASGMSCRKTFNAEARRLGLPWRWELD